jgi:hypothetical protein
LRFATNRRDARADEQGRVLPEVGEELLREGHRRVGDGHRAGADLGIRAYLFCDREGVLEQLRELLADGPGALCVAVGVLQLAEDLRLAEDHRVQPASHPEDVPQRGVVVQLEQRIGERRVQVVGVVQPVLQAPAARVVRHDVELGAIAGREQHGLVDAVDGAHGLERAGDLLPGEYHLLANFDRCRVMVQPEYFERHGRLRYGTGPVPGGIVHGVRIISELKAQFLVCVTYTPHYRGSGIDAAATG